MDKTAIIKAGIDYDSGVERFLGDIALYERVLEMFLSDTSLERARAAMAENDHKALFACVHEAKGFSGNADMTTLYKAACELSDLLRHDEETQEQISKGFETFENAYIQARDGIKRATEG